MRILACFEFRLCASLTLVTTSLKQWQNNADTQHSSYIITQTTTIFRLQVCNTSVKPRPHQQQCPSNIVECYKLNDSFNNVECCFGIVAVFGNNVAGFGDNVERNLVLSTMSKQIEQVQFVSTLSKGRNFTIKSFDIVAVCGNKVECCFDKVERCFDIVAGVDRALAFQFFPFHETTTGRHRTVFSLFVTEKGT